jgi:hypothetical protein
MSGKSAVLAQHDDDVVIVSALRTALTKVRDYQNRSRIAKTLTIYPILGS